MMKDCVVKDWRMQCLLLLCTAIQSTTSQCTNGIIRVNIIDQPNLKAGRISICDNGEWKAICHHGWGMQDARVACRQLGFPAAGARFCTRSCFGNSGNAMGISNFDCDGSETSLLQCTPSQRTKCNNGQVAGLICYATCPTCVTCPPPTTCPTCATYPTPATTASSTCPPCPPPTTCPTCATCPIPATTASSTWPPCPPPTTCPTCATCPTPATTSVPLTCPTSPPNVTASADASAVASTECAAAGGGAAIGVTLGVVSTLLLLTLVGVVTGWLWSCHRNKGKVKIRNNDGNFDNHTYSEATPTVLCVQYSSLGPQDMPTTGHTPPQEGEEGEYQEVEGGEGVYHVMGEGQVEGEGMVYEVPIQTQSQEQRDESAGRAVEMAYSTLHHN